MRYTKNILFLFLFSLLALQCSKKDANQAPSVVSLIFPSENLLCIDNTVEFNWSDAIDPEANEIEYKITVATDRGLTNIVESRTVTTSQIVFNLEKATAYYWQVDALDIDNNLGSSSETYAFYTQGTVIENYAPFSPKVITPENSAVVNAGTVFLRWIAEDINTTDVLTYELYFGENDNLVLIESNLNSQNYEVTAEKGKTYSWQINVKDQNGAKSIGQVWTFSVN
jgi:hypothetical protein